MLADGEGWEGEIGGCVCRENVGWGGGGEDLRCTRQHLGMYMLADHEKGGLKGTDGKGREGEKVN